MPAIKLRELFPPYFTDLPDPRSDRSKAHDLLAILVLALCATLGGANGWADIERFARAKRDFFRQFLELPNGIPSHDPFGRVVARLDPAALLACIQRWLTAFRAAVDRELVAIDGKTLRGSFDTAAGQSPLPLVSAWATEARLVLGQVAAAAPSNEITAMPLLLELLDLKGCIVTIDALGCQKEIVAALRAQQADYVLTVKGNQESLYEDIVDFFVAGQARDFAGIAHRSCTTVDDKHGRHETRHYTGVAVPEATRQRHAWPDLRSLGMVHSERQVGEGEVESRFFISSLTLQVKRFSRAVRGQGGLRIGCIGVWM